MNEADMRLANSNPSFTPVHPQIRAIVPRDLHPRKGTRPRFAEGCAYGMKIHASVDKDSSMIHSVVVAAASVHDLTPAVDLLHGDEQVICADAGYQGIANKPEMAGMTTEFRVAIRPRKCRALPDTPDGKLQDLIETTKALIRSKVEYPFRVIKQQFGFQKTRLRGLANNRCRINVLVVLSNLSQA